MATGDIKQVTNNSENGYCKMPDGTLICWGGFSTPGGTASQWGALYVIDYAVNVLFPVEFYSTPSVSVVCDQVSSGVVSNILYNTAKITQVACVRQTSTDYNKNWKYIAVGRWKA